MLNRKGALVLTSFLVGAILLYVVPDAGRWDQHTDHLLRTMQIETGDWVADVGSGEGKYTLPMARAVGDSGRAFAVDLDEDNLEELNAEIADRDVENVTVVSSIYDNPMLPRRSFDAVLVRNAYHEFTAREEMLQHLYAALEPAGRLVLAEYIGDDLIEKDRQTQVDNHELAPRFARRELKQAGFEIVNEVNSVRDSRFALGMRYLRRELKRTGAEILSEPVSLKNGISGYRMWTIVALRPSTTRGS